MLNFQTVKFIMGISALEQLPISSLPEVAFVGRSNVGKSSLINALCNHKKLARVSNTPGRTREINFFDVEGKVIIADLPGYGYAKASKKDVAGWNRMVFDYLRARANLRRVFLLIDSRHGLKGSDIEVMKILDDHAVTYQLVFTKTDKLRPSEPAQTTVDFKKFPALHPEIIVTSSETKAGINLLQEEVNKLVIDKS